MRSAVNAKGLLVTSITLYLTLTLESEGEWVKAMEIGNARLTTVHQHFPIDTIWTASPAMKHRVRLGLWRESDVRTRHHLLGADLRIALQFARVIHLTITGLATHPRIGRHQALTPALKVDMET